jgi:hypothetical protein
MFRELAGNILKLMARPVVMCGRDVWRVTCRRYSLSSAYGSPVSTVSIQCPASRKRAVWTVTTAIGAGAITQGSFTVTVSKAGVPYTTTPIAWNAASVSGTAAHQRIPIPLSASFVGVDVCPF